MTEFISSPSNKIIDIINSKRDETWMSIEFFPPRTEVGVASLHKLMEKFKNICSVKNPEYPIFADFTWGAGGSTSDLTFDLCVKAKQEYNLNPNMHLTCTNMDITKVDKALHDCHEAEICNIVALRGDPPAGQEKWAVTEGGFTCALDLVRYIRQKYDDYFCISVAGYPEGHPSSFKEVEGGIESLTETELQRYCIDTKEDGTQRILVCKDEDYEVELNYLKEKVDAGASIILTQMFFDAEVYGHFVQQCRAKGITVPIIPGIMALANYGGFKRMTGFCKTRIPPELASRLEAIKEDEAKIKALGVEIGTALCRRVVELGAPGLHFYTLNMSDVTFGTLSALGYLPTTELRL
eukprot:gene4636-9204_t